MAASLKKSWSGTLKLGFVTQQVAVYATTDSKAAKVAFNGLHADCGSRMNAVSICRTCDESKAVQSADILKGFEFEKGQYVTVSEAELKACQVETTKIIELKEFVPLSEVSPLMIADSSFIAPLVSDMSEAYVLIREALQGMAGIGTLCISNKEKLVAIVASGRGLVMHTLRHASEVRDVMNVPTLGKLPETADANTVKMMRALMASMETPTLDLEKYPNRYVENVHELIRQKVEAKKTGKEVVAEVKAAVPTKTISSLTAMLEASLAAKKVDVTTEL